MLRIALTLTLTLFATSLCPRAVASPGLTLEAQHTNTGEVRDIALLAGRVFAATSGGLAVHRGSDGAHLFTATTAQGLPGNNLHLVRPLDDARLLVGGDFGAVVVSWSKRSPSRPADLRIRAASVETPDRFDPVFDLVDAGRRTFLVRLQSGAVPLRRSPVGLLAPAGAGAGMWRSGAALGGHLLLGGLDGALACLGRDSLRPEPEHGLMLERPVLALTGAGDAILVATGESLLAWRPGSTQELRLPVAGSAPPVAATALTQDPTGGVLVGTAHGAVLRAHDDALQWVARDLGAQVTALARDGASLWLGLGRQGLHRLPLDNTSGLTPLRPAGEICDNHVTHLTRHRGRLVAGSFDRGACVLEAGGWRALTGLPSPLVHGLASDGRDLYVATSGGIARYDRQLRPRPIGQADPLALRWLAASAATGATEVGPRQVALSSAHGLLRIWRRPRDRTRVRFTSHDNGVPFGLSALSAAGGEIYLGSETEGVKAMGFGEGAASLFQDPVHLAENWVTALHALDQDDLWVGTCQGGAAHIRGGASTQFRRASGLADDRVVALVADREQAFVGTLGGLSRIDAASGAVDSFGLADGLPDLRSAGLLLEGRVLWYASESGLAVFRREPDPGQS